jgi:hypothetical protein
MLLFIRKITLGGVEIILNLRKLVPRLALCVTITPKI